MKETTASDSLHTPPPPSYIPFDVITETILCRLPVKSLLRFRCICKPFDSLISNDLKFATNHLLLSPKHQHLIATSWKNVKHLTLFSSPLDPFNLHSTFTNVPTLLDYYCPFIPASSDGLVASCDGLLCFAVDNRSVVLYNPSIRKVNKLPCLVLPELKVQGSTLFAFGYDPYIRNYKVVALFWYMYRFDMDIPKIQVEVHTYALGTDSWKMIKDFPSMYRFSRYERLKYGVFVSGAVNWLAYHRLNGNATIVSLHLGTESFREILQPDYGNVEILTLELIRDCLCLITQESRTYGVIDVWLMKEYGNKESWIKFICLPRFSKFSKYSYLSRLKKILYVSNDNNHVLVVFGEEEDINTTWVVYDLKTDTIKSSKIEDNLGMVKSKVYVESLISP